MDEAPAHQSQSPSIFMKFSHEFCVHLSPIKRNLPSTGIEIFSENNDLCGRVANLDAESTRGF